MNLQELKTELVSFIENSNNEELLSLLKEDIHFYTGTKGADVTDHLNDEQFADLKALAEEPGEKDTMSVEEFTVATQKWRTK